MTYWIKISYDKNEYVIDLVRVSAFCYEPNGRLKFWLPDSSFPVVLHPQSHPEAYQKVVTYIQQITGATFDSYWVKILYERNDYLINLKCISAFRSEPNGRVTLWLRDGLIAIVIHPQSNREAYEKVLAYIKQETGYSMGSG